MELAISPGYRRQEATDLLRRLGFAPGLWGRGLGIHVALMVAFGAAIPILKGLEFFDPFILTAYACLAGVLAAPLAAQPFPEPVMARVDARIQVCLLYGELVALGVLAAGIATVYWTHRGGIFFPPELEALARGVGFGFVLALALSMAAAWTALRFSTATAKAGLRVVFLALMLLYWLRGRFLAEVMGEAGAAALVVAVGFRMAMRSAVMRRRGSAA